MLRSLVGSEMCIRDRFAGEQHKMMLCVNMACEMKQGKKCAQCAHAAVGAWRKAQMMVKEGDDQMRNSLWWWANMGQMKIALKAKDEPHLLQLERQAKEAGLCCSKIRDAGKTQIAAGTLTVVAIGPGPESKINEITSGLKLL
eukprot:TRINITY_DN23090_c0_g1_i1.p1 TRINITY_DN23090_c0_g1~~TRINITY_DN23090_c0_g1_i1.p1  ORF type:complete len:143 (-),score=40.69 TRINITY_DN23090_c0_g1_i1:223-651(-)